MRRTQCPWQQFLGSSLEAELRSFFQLQALGIFYSQALFMIIVMTLVFGVYSLEDHGLFVEILWIFSTYLESISMLPQQPGPKNVLYQS